MTNHSQFHSVNNFSRGQKLWLLNRCIFLLSQHTMLNVVGEAAQPEKYYLAFSICVSVTYVEFVPKASF